jgi:hypothetical protein
MILNAYFLFAVYINKNYQIRRYFFVDFFDVEVIEGVEFSRVIVSVLLSIEIDDTCIGNDAEFFRPLISFEHALCALPNQPYLW